MYGTLTHVFIAASNQIHPDNALSSYGSAECSCKYLNCLVVNCGETVGK